VDLRIVKFLDGDLGDNNKAPCGPIDVIGQEAAIDLWVS
jgi:hypothetical protein